MADVSGTWQPDRREFLGASAGLITLAALGEAVPVRAQEPLPANNHLVPADKGLKPEWVKSLYLRGTPEVFRGDDLSRIGMPIGGIGCGQLYLRGDGTLTAWRIFNKPGGPQPPVEQGFALTVKSAAGTVTRRLNREGFAGVTFRGEYPLATVRYFDPDLPVRAELAAWSPFIPLQANDSNLPATVFEFTVENTSDAAVSVDLAGWIENAVGLNSGPDVGNAGERKTVVTNARGRAIVQHSGLKVDHPTPVAVREPIVLATFEGDTYGDWKVTGEAFGTGPAKGTLDGQQVVSGFQDKGLVNTFLGGDGPQGTLTSPAFSVDRKYVNFLIGGGGHAGQTCLNLLVDGKVVRTATGHDDERLAWASWDVQAFAGKQATLQIVDKNSDAWGHINVDQIELADAPRSGAIGPFDKAPDYGTLALALAEAGVPVGDVALPLPLHTAVGTFPIDERKLGAVRSAAATLAPKAKKTFTFVLAWHFPNAPNGQFYATRFADAAAVATHVLDEHTRLAKDTRLWRDTWYDSTLPYWLLDRLHSTVSYLATGTALWWGNGRFWCWEGVNCCDGTCTHVWNYAHATAHVFPEVERIIRTMQDYDAGFDERTGLVGFRSNRAYAADGQCGTVLKMWREHTLSADDSFLKPLWPRVKQSLEFLLGHDGNDDGLIEDSQPNTYDIDFFGPNTFVGSLYLAALRAGEEMAREMGDTAFAERCHKVFESGSKKTIDEIFDGEYFIQKVDLKQHPQWQYADGCLADQLFGQGWAHHTHLGYIYPEDKVKSGLRSVWKYCWAPDVGPQNKAHPPQRWFLSPGEPGLFICTWPRSKHLGNNAVLYRDEVWTGIEYQVAGHMVWEGMVDEALVICRAVHDRYNPAKRNPYNEIECGDHYGRALASWGVYTALSGFEYHGPKGHIAFAPKVTPGAFKAAFTAAEGWGTYEQTRAGAKQTAKLTLKKGKLRLRSQAFVAPAGVKAATVTLAGKPVPCTSAVREGRVAVTFSRDVVVGEGQVLEVSIA